MRWNERTKKKEENFDKFNQTGTQNTFSVWNDCRVCLCNVSYTLAFSGKKTDSDNEPDYLHVCIKQLDTVRIRLFCYIVRVTRTISTIIFVAFPKMSFSFDLLSRPNNS